MQQRSKFIQRTSALALAAVLALGMGVQAAGPSTSTVDDRREDLTIFYETLKDSHPDLFANTPEETFLARKAEITEHLDTASIPTPPSANLVWEHCSISWEGNQL